MKKGDLILYGIARELRNKEDKLHISSSKLGKSLGISQQTASRYLKWLEKDGLIKRRVIGKGQEIELTEKGLSILKEMHSELERVLRSRPEPVTLIGEVVTGIGEGAYYIKEYEDKIKEKVGFKPFYGTLNIRTNKNTSTFRRHMKITIGAFEKKGRKFGEILLTPVMLIKGKRSTGCYLIIPERKHQKDEAEIISSFNLREKLKIKDGDSVRIQLP